MEGSLERSKLNNCLICNKESHITDRKDVYTKLFIQINHLVSPSSRKDATQFNKVFDYCADCVEHMDELCKLKEGLENILKSIKREFQSLKFAILKSEPSGNACIDSFRRFAVNEFCPRVRLDLNNALLKDKTVKKNKIGEQEKVQKVCPNVRSNSTENSTESLDAEEGSDSDNSRDSPLTIVPVPKPFPKAVDDVNINYRTENEKSIENQIEDSIIVVTEPPKFVKSQSHIYFENYKDMYKCKFCSVIVKGGNNHLPLSRHINVVHAKNSRFKCAICFAIFFSRTKCRTHVSESHFDSSKNSHEYEPVNSVLPSVKSSIPQNKSSNSTTDVAKKKTAPIGTRNRASKVLAPPYIEKEQENYTNRSVSYSDDKVRSEIVINIEPKTTFDLVEEDVVRFEPWDESSTDGTSAAVDPLQGKSPQLTDSSSSSDFEDSNAAWSTNKKSVQQKGIESIDEIVEKIWEKPQLSYTHLAVIAIKHSNTVADKFMPFSAICKYIKDHFPWYKSDTSEWQRSLSDALSGECFNCQQEDSSMERCYIVVENNILKIKETIRTMCTKSINSMKYPELLEKIIKCVIVTQKGSKNNSGTVSSGSNSSSADNDFEDTGFQIVEHVSFDKSKIVTGTRVIRTEISKEEIELLKAKNAQSKNPPKTQVSNSDWNPPSEHTFLQRCVDTEKNDYGRPPFTYTHLSFLAINSSESKSLKISDIHNFIKEAFPFFHTYQANWKNSLYLCLKTNECFKLIKLDATTSRQARLPSRFAWAVANAEDTSIINIKKEIVDILMTQTSSIYEAIGNQKNLEDIIRRSVGNSVDFDFLEKERKSFLKSRKRQITNVIKMPEKRQKIAEEDSLRIVEPEPEPEVVLPDTLEEVSEQQQQPSMTIFTPLPLYNIVVPLTITPIKQENSKVWSKPNISYEHLAMLAILNSCNKDKFVSLPEILEFLREHFPWFHALENSNLDIPWIKDMVKALSSNYFTWKMEKGSDNGFIKSEEDALQLDRHYAVVENGLIEIKQIVRGILNENIECMAHPEILERMVSNVVGSSFDALENYQDDSQPKMKIVSISSGGQNQKYCKQEGEMIEVEQRLLPLTFLAPVGFNPTVAQGSPK